MDRDDDDASGGARQAARGDTSLTRAAQIALVERYFAAVDAQDIEGVLATLSEACVFTVETHGVRLQGHEAIAGMLQRLWRSHQAVRHDRFRFVPDAQGHRIAAQFRVQNTELDGSVTVKSNCNFFDLSGDRFVSVAVYMAGPNTLDEDGRA